MSPQPGHRAGHLLPHVRARARSPAKADERRVPSPDRDEAMLAHALRHDRHARHDPRRASAPKMVVGVGERRRRGPMPRERPASMTTVGRCIFNDILPAGMPSTTTRWAEGRRPRSSATATARLGAGGHARPAGPHQGARLPLHARWRGCPSASSDLPRSRRARTKILDEAQKRVDRIESDFQSGAITDGERYNQIIDVWIHAREEVTEELMTALEHDRARRTTPTT